MAACDLEQTFGFRSFGIETEAELEGDDLVVSAVYDQDGATDVLYVLAGVVVELGEEVDGHVWVELLADLLIGSEGTLEYEGAGFYAGGEVRGDAAAE